MADDEILIKVALELENAKSEFKDFSGLWKTHNNEIQKGNAAMQKQADEVATAYTKVNKKIKENISQVANEGKAIDQLGKKFDSLNKKNKESFDSKELDKFNETLKKVSGSIGQLDKLELSTEDIDQLSKKLANVEDDFEALNVLVDFFESKMTSASVNIADSFDVLKQKIEETKLNIQSTEAFIKNIDKDIESTAPGQVQANLIQERDEAKKALLEEKVALEDYNAQLRKSREESVSMETQLRRVKEELIQLELAGDRGSERWQELTADATKYNEAIKNTNAEINRTSKSTAGLDNLIGAATGIVALFTAAQGAAALFGDENEDLQKSLVKVTGAIALLNGLQQIQTELTKKETLAGKALTFVRTQYALATDASAKATLRLAAATKLIGIGLLVGALAAIVFYWKDISKAIGITSDETERLNKINKAAITGATSEIGRLKSLQLELQNVNTPLDRQKEIKKGLLEQYPTYLKALGDEKSTAKDIEEAFNKLNQALIINAKLKAAQELISEEFAKVLEAERKAAAGELTTLQFITNGIKQAAGVQVSTVGADAVRQNQENLQKVKNGFVEFEEWMEKYLFDNRESLNALGGDPTKDGERLKAILKEYEKFGAIMESLIKRQESYRLDLIENSREKEKQILKSQLDEEKAGYLKQINDLKISEEAKLRLRQEYNKLYNEETGTAYEEYRKTIEEIDRKYDEQLEKVRFDALSAIGAVYDTSEQLEREAIAKKWDGIRKELEEQIKLTNDELQKQELRSIINYTVVTQGQEETDFDRDTELDRIDRQKEIADSILRIYQTNARDIIQNEELKQLQLLRLEQQYLDNVIKAYRDSIKGLDNQSLFEGLIETLQTSVDPAEIEEAGNKLREALGDKTANEILKTVSALREVSQGIDDIGEKTTFEKLIDDFSKWTISLESFSLQLARTLGLQGKAAQEFAEGVATAIQSTFDSLVTIFDAEIEEHRNKVDSFQQSIDDIEQEIEREKQLYEDGYANNYEARKEDLENLKEQKRQEEEELKKAQKRKAALAKAELLIDTVSQLGNLITAASNIFKWASKIPFIGVPLAIGLIGTMFGAFAIAKTKAFQAIGQGQNFRKGLQEGPLSLKGPRHEERGFGLYNSKTGERVAEFEDGEDVLVVNSLQKRKYKHVLDALIADAQGRGSIDSTLEGYYGIKKTGEQTIKVVRHVNEITVKAQRSKENSSKDSDEMLNQLKKLNNNFEKEFDGYKKERDNETDSWQTPEFFYVKKGNVTKKYPKNK